MPLANVNRIKSRVNALLLLNDTYSATNSGQVGRYQSDQELTDAILQADVQVCEAICSVSNHPARAAFLVGVSGNLLNGTLLPVATGMIGQVLLTSGNNVFIPGKLARSKDEITEAIELGADVYGNIAGFYFVQDNLIYHTSLAARVGYCVVAIGTSPQAPDIYEQVIIDGALSALLKDGGDTSQHQISEQKFQAGISNIRAFPRVETEQQSFERATARA